MCMCVQHVIIREVHGKQHAHMFKRLNRGKARVLMSSRSGVGLGRGPGFCMAGFLPHSRPHCGSSHIARWARRLCRCTGSQSHIHSPQHTLLGTAGVYSEPSSPGSKCLHRPHSGCEGGTPLLPGREGGLTRTSGCVLGFYSCLPSFPSPYPSVSHHLRQKVWFLHGLTVPPAAWQALT